MPGRWSGEAEIGLGLGSQTPTFALNPMTMRNGGGGPKACRAAGVVRPSGTSGVGVACPHHSACSAPGGRMSYPRTRMGRGFDQRCSKAWRTRALERGLEDYMPTSGRVVAHELGSCAVLPGLRTRPTAGVGSHVASAGVLEACCVPRVPCQGWCWSAEPGRQSLGWQAHEVRSGRFPGLAALRTGQSWAEQHGRLLTMGCSSLRRWHIQARLVVEVPMIFLLLFAFFCCLFWPMTAGKRPRRCTNPHMLCRLAYVCRVYTHLHMHLPWHVAGNEPGRRWV